MPAQIARFSFAYGASRFHCCACGEALLRGEEGLSDTFCQHVVAVVDWIGELTIGPAVTSRTAKKIQKALEDEANAANAIARVLPEVVVVFDFVEPARGGGHDESTISFAMDFSGCADSGES